MPGFPFMYTGEIALVFLCKGINEPRPEEFSFK